MSHRQEETRPIGLDSSSGHLLRVSWLMILVATCTATAVPWVLGFLDIDYRPVAWTLFALASLILVAALSPQSLSGRSSRWISGISQTAGVAGLVAVWVLSGATQNPMLLLVFCLPVLASGLLANRWQPYALSAWTIGLVSLVAVVDAPSLRWYLTRMGLPLEPLWRFLPERPELGPDPFPALDSQPGLLFTSLLLFAILLLASAFLSESLSTVLLRFTGRLRSSEIAVQRAENLAAKMLAASPEPALWIHRGSGRIARASDSFHHTFLVDRGAALEVSLTDLLEFVFPDEVARALSDGTDLPSTLLRVGRDHRTVRLAVRSLGDSDDDYLYVTLRDTTGSESLAAGLDALAEPIFLLGPSGELVHLNRAASQLFPQAAIGDPAEAALEGERAPRGWWRSGVRARHERTIELFGDAFRAELITTRFMADQSQLTLVRLEQQRAAA